MPDNEETLLEPGVIRKKIIPVRPETPTRHAIELVIVQRENLEGKITTPSLTIRGKLDTYIESWGFAKDLGVALIVAAFYMSEWSFYVSRGKK